MARYRKKPVVVDAVRFTDTGAAVRLISDMADCDVPVRHLRPEAPVIYIDTLEGRMQANLGDWIIRGSQGELYPCKHAAFEDCYEPADQPAGTGKARS
ncbi:MAG TPA: hypothetical protein VK324_06690 [Tepidisphaeraceae bacterium]|nr:hypothetical protein [Tepidisphaeraceae bacterium]